MSLFNSPFNVAVLALSAFVAVLAIVVFLVDDRRRRRVAQAKDNVSVETASDLPLLARHGPIASRWKTRMDNKPFALQDFPPPPEPPPTRPAPSPVDLSEYAVEVTASVADDVTPLPEEVFRPRGKTPRGVVANDRVSEHVVDVDKTPAPLVAEEFEDDRTVVTDLSPIAALMKTKKP